MTSISINKDRRGYLSAILEDLISCGWKLESVPQDGKVPRNGMMLRLRANGFDVNLRLFVYKVTNSGRNRPDERRVEITTTYHGGLNKEEGFSDVVLGIDQSSARYVGVDNRRLQIGGKTHNASSFFDLEGLSIQQGNLLVNPRSVSSGVFTSGIEYHFFL